MYFRKEFGSQVVDLVFAASDFASCALPPKTEENAASPDTGDLLGGNWTKRRADVVVDIELRW